jgi:hypothetical protein
MNLDDLLNSENDIRTDNINNIKLTSNNNNEYLSDDGGNINKITQKITNENNSKINL